MSVSQFLRGMLDGYGTVMQFDQINKDRKSRDEDRQWQLDQRARQRKMNERDDAEWAAKTAKIDALKAAGKPITAEELPDEPTPDTGDPAAGGVPTARPRRYKVAGQIVEGDLGRDAALARANTRGAVAKRKLAAAQEHGDDQMAAFYRQQVQEAQQEGALEFVAGMNSNPPDVQQIVKAGGRLSMDIPADLRSNYDGAGKLRIPDGARVEWFVTKDPVSGKDVADWRPVMPDGTTLFESGRRKGHEFALGLKGLMEMDRGNAQLAETRAQGEHARNHQTATLEETRRHNKATEGIQSRAVDVRSTLADARINGLGGDGNSDGLPDKLPPAVAAQAQDLRQRIKDMSSARYKAQVEGMLVPGSDADKQTQTQLMVAQAQYRKLLEPYMPGYNANAAADPAGLRAGPEQAAPKPGTPAAAANQGLPQPTKPTQPAAPVPASAPAPRTVEQVLNASNGNDGALRNIGAQRAQQVEALGAQLAAAQQQLSAVAKSGDPQALRVYAEKVQQARSALEAALKSIPEHQRGQVMQALGL